MTKRSAFAKKVKAALATAPSEDALAGVREWHTILQEFAQNLSNEPFDLVRADVVRGAAPGVYRLVLWPMSRRDERVTMLVFHFLGGTGRVMDKLPIEFKKLSDLEDFLIAYAQLPAFRRSLEELQQRASEKSEGYLRKEHPSTRDPRADVLVCVPGDQQLLLAKSAEKMRNDPDQSPPIKIYVVAEGARSIAEGIYSPQENYAWLVTSGFALAITTHVQIGSNIEIEGQAQILSKLSQQNIPGIKRVDKNR